jgi:hypothetical protein
VLCVEDGRYGIGKPTKEKEQYDMKHLNIALGLILTVGLMAVMASPALATPKWITCEQLSKPTGKWTTNKCSTRGTGEWETEEIGSTVEITSSGTLTLEDRGEKTAVECTEAGSGTLGKGGTGSAKAITINCGFVKGEAGSCEESKRPTASAVNLPWSDRLEERTNAKSEKEIREVTTSSISGKAPGWSVECTVSGVLKVKDECTGVYSTNVTTNRTVGTLGMEFEEVTEKEPATCTLGGKEHGFARGSCILSLSSRKGEAVTLLSVWTE